jgi:hypothetical protein
MIENEMSESEKGKSSVPPDAEATADALRRQSVMLSNLNEEIRGLRSEVSEVNLYSSRTNQDVEGQLNVIGKQVALLREQITATPLQQKVGVVSAVHDDALYSEDVGTSKVATTAVSSSIGAALGSGVGVIAACAAAAPLLLPLSPFVGAIIGFGLSKYRSKTSTSDDGN